MSTQSLDAVAETEARLRSFPAWAKTLDVSLATNSQMVIAGQIRDRQWMGSGLPKDAFRLTRTLDVITAVLTGNDYDVVIGYDVADGLRVLHESSEGLSGSLTGRQLVRPMSMPVTLAELAEILRAIVATRDVRAALVVDYASRLTSDGQVDPEARQLHVVAEKLAHAAVPLRREGSRESPLYNPVIWLADQEHDLPSWLTAIDPVRVISIPLPEMDVRERAASGLVPVILGYNELDHASKLAAHRHFAELTNGMSLRSLIEICRLAADLKLPIERMEDAVRCYRVGIRENPWRNPYLKEKIRSGYEDIIGQEESNTDRASQAPILGQNRAVRKAMDILVRSAMGLTGSQAGSTPGRPQGVLFFTGPTGVGKTALAKRLAQLVFGTKESYVRFDMSEFSAEESAARLIGSPPGFIGHDAGGELTNAIRERPYCLVLFDEIEKAHERILDKFLQILEDGRLTDGSGNTVFFSESIIVFTSNLGVYKEAEDGRRIPIVTPGTPYKDVEHLIRASVEDHFTKTLGRPELLNRIGDNIVVFDFISREVGQKLVHVFLKNVCQEAFRQLAIRIEISENAHDQIAERALASLDMGGRGIGNVIESMFVNPLARALFDLPDDRSAATVTGLVELESGWQVELA
ncbi:AAA family ATPase [Arthrobacter bambusae]|uniref:AAA family ATPase n=1 Tax=Arthrobacter bambusae TaxID=1338426 RepID=UPI001F512CAE|nr:AAA family ATPase [Arthrobacter bambusae]MCI0144046.1 AAA family ATPase [Arthrobacter bambusae]